jgi:hypothetical protein
VGELVACGCRATRNDDGSERECACSIVADLLKDLGVNLSYPGVAKVWAERAYLYPHLPGAAFPVVKIEPSDAARLIRKLCPFLPQHKRDPVLAALDMLERPDKGVEEPR